MICIRNTKTGASNVQEVVVGMVKAGTISTLLSESYLKSGLTLFISWSHHMHTTPSMCCWQLDKLTSDA